MKIRTINKISIKRLIPIFVWFALLSAIAFAGRNIVTKFKPSDISLAQLVFMQSALSLPLLMFVSFFQRKSLAPSLVYLNIYTKRIAWGVAHTVILFLAIQLMPVALASTLSYTAPLFLALLAPIFLAERNSIGMLILTFLGFIGVGINAIPYLDQVGVGVLAVGLLTGLSGAFSQVYIRKLARKGENGIVSVFWMHAFGTVFSAIWCSVTDDWDISAIAILFGAIIAALSSLGQVTNAAAYSHGTALPVNALSLLTLPITFALAYILLAEDITLLSIIGILITLPACFGLVWLAKYRSDLSVGPAAKV